MILYLYSVLTGLSKGAFANCSSLTYLFIPEKVQNIGYSAFNLCPNLKIVIDDNNQYYKEQDGIVYNYDMTQIAFVTEGLKEVTIPASITQLSGFEGNKQLVKVKFEEGSQIESIGGFKGCKNLTEIELPSGIYSINREAFSECVNLKNISIPDGTKLIGEAAFLGCTGLTSVVIPESVTEMSGSVFSNCSNLQYAEINAQITAIDYMFNDCKSLLEVKLPDTLKQIGFRAFSGCGQLKNISIPSSLTEIGGWAFSDCSSLESLIFPETLTTIGENVFYCCTSLQYIDISSVTQLGPNAFNSCYALSEVELSQKLTALPQYIFFNCKSITKINLSQNLKEIGESAFYGCSSLEDVILPETLQTIGSYAFAYCSSLKILSIPSGVNQIGYNAFWGPMLCLSIDENNHSFIEQGGIIFDKDFTSVIFATNSAEYVTIPATVETISWIGNTNIKTIKFEENSRVTVISEGTFASCDGLIEIELPDHLEEIADRAFFGLKGLRKITLPSTLKTIGNNAFSNCYKLIYIKNLSSLDLKIGSIDYGQIAQFAKVIIDKDGNKIYSEGSDGIEYIQTADGWRFTKDLKTEELTLVAYLGEEETVVLPTELQLGGKSYSYKISGLVGVKNAIFLDGVTEIDEFAFSDCSTLQSVIIPDSVTKIGDYAFNCCNNLQSITLSKNISDFGRSVFDGTALYNNPSNWKNGALIIDNYLIKVVVDPSITCLDVSGVKGICPDAIGGSYLKILSLHGGNNLCVLDDLSNLETLIISEAPTQHYLTGYFKYMLPITLKNIVFKKGFDVKTLELFTGLTNVTVYVEDEKIAKQWDHDYPGWNNGNKVYYGGEWINAEFKDSDGNILSSEYYTVNQVIRQPFVADVLNGNKKLVFVGWDIDGDGTPDGIPATSTHNISATAVMKEVDNECVINFYDYFGNLYSSETYAYGETIVLPENPVKKGYIFNGWRGYEVGAVATESMDYYSVWSHDDGGHNYVLTTVSPTCENDGYDLHVCSVCDHEYRDNYVEALGHQFGEWITDLEATCTENGLKHHVCSVCDTSVSEEIAAHGHDYAVIEEILATCTRQGKKAYECSYCGDSVEETTPALEHEYKKEYVSKSWLEWLIDRLLNIFFGYEGKDAFYYRCVNCGHIQTMAEAANSSTAAGTCEHDLSDWTTALAPTCTEEGISAKYCSKCNEMVEAKVADALGHDITHHEAKAAACTAIGWEAYDTCSRCDYTTYKEIAALGHKEASAVEENRVEATCTEKGHYDSVIYCSVCHEELSREQKTIDALGHDITHHEAKAAACTAIGWEAYDTCSRCDYTTYKEIAALGHKEASAVEENRVEATCTEKGHYDSVIYCSVCHEELSREQKTIDALGHDITHHEAKAAACTAIGWEAYDTCSRCDYTTYKEIAALGHKEASAVEENRVEATCTEKGHYDSVIYCSVCHEELSREQKTIEALGHKFGEWTRDVEPTTLLNGHEYRECTRCNHKEERSVPRLENAADDKEQGCLGTVGLSNSLLFVLTMVVSASFVLLKKKQ